jgi:hypothetical protein
LLVVFGGVHVMAMCHRGVMRRLFMVPSLVVLCGLPMVLGCVFMVVRSLFVVFVNFAIFHRRSPGFIVC